MVQMPYVHDSIHSLFGISLLAQNASGSKEFYAERGYFDDLMENPGEYFYVIIIFIVLGYLLWRVQRLGKDD